MIANGRLIPITSTEGGFQNGRVVPSVEVKGEPVACNYKSNTSDLIRYYDDSGYKVAKYIVYVDGTDFKADTVELVDKSGEAMGKYEIHNLERLHTVNRTKLLL